MWNFDVKVYVLSNEDLAYVFIQVNSVKYNCPGTQRWLIDAEFTPTFKWRKLSCLLQNFPRRNQVNAFHKM